MVDCIRTIVSTGVHLKLMTTFTISYTGEVVKLSQKVLLSRMASYNVVGI